MRSSTPSPSAEAVEFFGVRVDAFSADEILGRAQRAFEAGERLRIATVNPEYLLEARGNNRFRESLRKADLCLPDGTGVVLAARLFGKKIKRIPGADLLSDLLGLAQASGAPAALLVNGAGLSSYEEIREALAARFPNLSVLRLDGSVPAPDRSLVLCNYGAPLQEFMLEQLPGGGVRVGVGGALDFLTGKIPRAPRLLRSFGFEWLWRLFLQPKRSKRIWNAVVVFPIRAIFDTIRR